MVHIKHMVKFHVYDVHFASTTPLPDSFFFRPMTVCYPCHQNNRMCSAFFQLLCCQTVELSPLPYFPTTHTSPPAHFFRFPQLCRYCSFLQIIFAFLIQSFCYLSVQLVLMKFFFSAVHVLFLPQMLRGCFFKNMTMRYINRGDFFITTTQQISPKAKWFT